MVKRDMPDPEYERDEEAERRARARKRKKAEARRAAEAAKKKRELMLTASFVGICAAAVFGISSIVNGSSKNKTAESTAALSTVTADMQKVTAEVAMTTAQQQETDAVTTAAATETAASETAAPETTAPETETAAPETTTAPTPAAEENNAPYENLQTGDSMQPQGNVWIPSWITQDLLSYSPMHRTGEAIGHINYVCVHYVANPGSTAKGNRDYFEENSDGRSVSSHFIIGMHGEILQCVPINEVAYAQGSSTGVNHNYDAISIENCHPGEDGKFSSETYWSLVKLSAWLLQMYGLDQNALIRHYDATGKPCPAYYVDNPEAWEQFKNTVGQYMIEHPNIAAEYP